MRIAAIVIVAACETSGHSPPRDAAVVPVRIAWTLTVDVTHPTFGDARGNTITLDALGDMRHSDFGVDLGRWHVEPADMTDVRSFEAAPDLLAAPVPSNTDMGDAPYVVVTLETPSGVTEKRYRNDETPPPMQRMRGALKALVDAHDLENLADLGPFTVEEGDVKIDSSGDLPRYELAPIATVLRSPDLDAVTDAPAEPEAGPPSPETTFVIVRKGVTRRITTAVPWPGVLEALDHAVRSAQ